MPRIEHVTLRVGRDSTAQADVVVDGVEHRSLILRRHRSKVYVAWPRRTKLARAMRRRLEPKIVRALDQWRDLAGGGS